MAVNNYTNRRNVNAQMNTRKNGRAGNGRRVSPNSHAQYQYGAAAAQPAPSRVHSSSQAAPARRQAPVRHQVDVRAEKGRVTLQASPVNKLGLLVVTLSFLFLGVMVLRYVGLQSDITQLRSNIQSLETQVNDLSASNDEYLNRIEASVDLEEVREIAIMDLGMVYASEDQIITYDSQIDDYLEQSVVVGDED
ncbi:MAG: hypothetical protein LUH19_08420 [Lachnospiraceae bacterium]|nr:hypothetical protein [Lachnospiraceae bacterium]